MRYATAAAFRQALDDRLKTEAARTGLPLARLRKQVAFELFLRRLVTVAPNRWVLKGALALELRLKATTRPTGDIDLGRADDEQAAIEDITAAQQLVLDDFFTYTAIRTDELDRTDEFAAVRFHITAQLAGRTFEQFTLDIGFTDSIPATPDTIKTSDLLAFADINPIDLPALPLSQHLAEKVHAYTRTYGATARRSTRPKDLVDILLIAASEPVDARALRTALESTFAERDQHELPSSLPTPPSEWADPYRRLAAGIGLEPDLSTAFAEAATFLDPILAGSSDGAWDAAHKRWT
jgi:predicted nucleotidyltransferase component of viral defense system